MYAIREAVEALLAKRTAVLPDVGGDWALLGRAVHRAWLEAGGRGPMLALDAVHVRDSDDIRAAARAVGDGLLHLGPGLAVPAGVKVATLSHSAEPDTLDPRLRRLDDVYMVAVDPTLGRIRDAVAGHARAREVVYLRGPRGSGRASVVRWAAVTHGAPGLAEVSPTRTAHPEDGDWLLLRELEELPIERLGALRARLGPPPGGSWIHRGEGERPQHPKLVGLIGKNAAFCRVLQDALRHASGNQPVLILGESGTGKEPLARFIHEASGRKGPYVITDLASRAPNLVADDLFGHAPGAFEGAKGRRDGAFRAADKGTLFLDELGNIPLPVQAQLLRVLDGQPVQPLGSDEQYRVDVRFVAATNADLEGMVLAGTFRADLYNRLKTLILRLPPLRDRGEDVILLAEHFAEQFGATGLDESAKAGLRDQAWPGNIRELRDLIRTAAREAHGGKIHRRHLRIPPQVPVFVTGAAEGLDQISLTRREVQTLSALSVFVPAPPERGEGCVRSALLAGLRGRPITADALGLLCTRPWWGNFLEMERKLAVIRELPPGILTLEGVLRVLPDLAAVPGRSPLHSLLAPSLRPGDDAIVGWRAQHHEGALLIGRARGHGDLDETRRRWLAQYADAAGFLSFPHIPELSRAQVLIERRQEGMVARLAPGAAMPTEAGPLGGLLQTVSEVPLLLGSAAELRLLRHGEPVVELFLFDGDDAYATAEPTLRLRLRHAVLVTQGNRARSGPLSDAALTELHRLILGFVEGEVPHLATWLKDHLPRASSPELPPLAQDSNVVQKVRRYYADKVENQRALRRLLAERSLLDRAKERLPPKTYEELLGREVKGRAPAPRSSARRRR